MYQSHTTDKAVVDGTETGSCFIEYVPAVFVVGPTWLEDASKLSETCGRIIWKGSPGRGCGPNKIGEEDHLTSRATTLWETRQSSRIHLLCNWLMPSTYGAGSLGGISLLEIRQPFGFQLFTSSVSRHRGQMGRGTDQAGRSLTGISLSAAVDPPWTSGSRSCISARMASPCGKSKLASGLGELYSDICRL